MSWVKWIRTSHRSPDTEREVLLYDANSRHMAVGTYHIANRTYHVVDQEFKPTHWAERPWEP